jgi:hypothetical protein
MSKVLVNESTLSSIAGAIRKKTGAADKYKPAEMAEAITQIRGGDLTFPEELLAHSGDCGSRFANDGWSEYIRYFGSNITTNNVTDTQNMFANSFSLEKVPFSINLANDRDWLYMGAMFSSCSGLKELPPIKLNGEYTGNGCNPQLWAMFNYCTNLKEIPNDYFDFIEELGGEYIDTSQMYGNCYSLRNIPPIPQNIKMISSFYLGAFENCFSLDELTDLPNAYLVDYNGSQAFDDYTFQNCSRVKNITFEAPRAENHEISWINQHIQLGYAVGRLDRNNKDTFLNCNNGITADTEVSDETTYQALKNHPDWWTTDRNYSRYNHDSAVATLESLPDISAFGSSSINFSGENGALTDGGAINTMTEEEIAIAAAKGWTVTMW